MQRKAITELLALPNFQVDRVLEQPETSLHFCVDLLRSLAGRTPVHS